MIIKQNMDKLSISWDKHKVNKNAISYAHAHE
jgi:hypothetical protein